MKKFLLASTFILLAPTMSYAADLPSVKVEPAPDTQTTASMNWSGPYVGAQVGYSLSDVGFVYHQLDYAYSLPETSLSQGLLGIRAGYDWQFHNFVIGIVADADRRFGTDGFFSMRCPPFLMVGR